MKRGKKFGLVFLVLGIALASLAFGAVQDFATILALSSGLAAAGLGTAYLLSWPGLLGKTRRGRLLVSSYLFFWPYHVLNYASLVIFRLLQVAPFQEIVPGLWLGGRLFPWERAKASHLVHASVLDLTCEFSEVGFLRGGPAYLCIPLLDGTAPSRTELEAGLNFIAQRLRAGPVYVHCAMGHGRSPTFVAGYLLATGTQTALEDAVKCVQSKRPGVKLRSEQLRALQQFCA